MTTLDLEYGSPDSMRLQVIRLRDSGYTHLYDYYLYNNSYRHDCGIPILIYMIKNLHHSAGNVSCIDDYEVVVGNGATQILQAAIYALSDNSDKVYAKAPYFPRFPRITKLASTGANFTDNSEEATIEILTHPNNPDNANYPKESKASKVILDGCYNWPWYPSFNKVDGDLLVFSLSKSLFSASTRIGWALVKDAKVAHKMREFIEYQTSDVSVSSQLEAVYLIRGVINNWDSFQPVLKNQEEFSTIIKNNYLRDAGEVLSNNNVFLWARFTDESTNAKDKILLELDAKVSGGELFGVTSNYFRINLLSKDLNRLRDYILSFYK